jgi:hypothetical protein
MCIFVSCLIVVPLPLGKPPFAVKLNNNNNTTTTTTTNNNNISGCSGKAPNQPSDTLPAARHF